MIEVDYTANKLIEIIDQLEDELLTCKDPKRRDEIIDELTRLYPMKVKDFEADSQERDREERREMEAEQKKKDNKRFWPKVACEVLIPAGFGLGGTILCLRHQKQGHLLDVKPTEIGSKIPKLFKFKK